VDAHRSTSEAPSTSPADLELEVGRVHCQYCAELVSYAALIVRSQDAARDAVQEAFLRYFVERRYGREIEYPQAWLYRVVRNYLLDSMDTLAARHEVNEDQAGDVRDQKRSPEEILRCAQMAQQIATLLSPREMECLRLRADGMSYDEIADAMGIASGTVSALLTRVHKKLRDAAKGSQDARLGTAEALSFLIARGGVYSS